jgi:hypothetical protein
MSDETITCGRFGCLDYALTPEQKEEAHRAHISSMAPPKMPPLAFCDRTAKDKTHHVDVYCKVMEEGRSQGSMYLPKTNPRVIEGLYPTGCPECAQTESK